ncbi:chitinase [Aspergillus sclerotialis]|uniref:Chitinase n=1 Tax=Aspergillus sclerotialis TaxID=2070753 RepID=A0A3A3A5K4_9EURO|nr:chitinase [Aspergillus sclerotialis]
MRHLGYLKGFDLAGMSEYVDWFNFMAYDIHGTWDGNSQWTQSVVNPHTNLTGRQRPIPGSLRANVLSDIEISAGLDLLWRNDIDPSKVTLGLGFYGRSFTLKDLSCTSPGCPFDNGTALSGSAGGGNPGRCTQTSGILSDYEIARILSGYSLDEHYDAEAGVKWITWNTDQWVSFDDAETLLQKRDFANSLCLAGTFAWALDLGGPGSMSSLANLDENAGMGGADPDGLDSGSGNVFIGHDIYSESDPTITCVPPCNFIFPPLTLSTPTTISFEPYTTSLEVVWVTTAVTTVDGGAVSTSTGYSRTIQTTTLTVPPVTTTAIDAWNWNITQTSAESKYTLSSSILPPPFRITNDPNPELTTPGVTPTPVVRSITPPPTPSRQCHLLSVLRGPLAPAGAAASVTSSATGHALTIALTVATTSMTRRILTLRESQAVEALTVMKVSVLESSAYMWAVKVKIAITAFAPDPTATLWVVADLIATKMASAQDRPARTRDAWAWGATVQDSVLAFNASRLDALDQHVDPTIFVVGPAAVLLPALVPIATMAYALAKDALREMNKMDVTLMRPRPDVPTNSVTTTTSTSISCQTITACGAEATTTTTTIKRDGGPTVTKTEGLFPPKSTGKEVRQSIETSLLSMFKSWNAKATGSTKTTTTTDAPTTTSTPTTTTTSKPPKPTSADGCGVMEGVQGACWNKCDPRTTEPVDGEWHEGDPWCWLKKIDGPGAFCDRKEDCPSKFECQPNDWPHGGCWATGPKSGGCGVMMGTAGVCWHKCDPETSDLVGGGWKKGDPWCWLKSGDTGVFCNDDKECPASDVQCQPSSWEKGGCST